MRAAWWSPGTHPPHPSSSHPGITALGALDAEECSQAQLVRSGSPGRDPRRWVAQSPMPMAAPPPQAQPAHPSHPLIILATFRRISNEVAPGRRSIPVCACRNVHVCMKTCACVPTCARVCASSSVNCLWWQGPQPHLSREPLCSLRCTPWEPG